MTHDADRATRLVAEQDLADKVAAVKAKFPARWPRTAKILGLFFCGSGFFLLSSAILMMLMSLLLDGLRVFGGPGAFAVLLFGAGLLSFGRGRRWWRDGSELPNRLEELHYEGVQLQRINFKGESGSSY